jgi:hypothetical protein
MRRAAAAALLFAALAGQTLEANPARTLSAQAVGGVRIGLPRAAAIRELTAVLGRPDRRLFTNSGCGPAFTEVAWKHFYAEFSRGRFSGFRYIVNGWPPDRAAVRPVRSDLPKLVTPDGIRLGSTLGELRAVYGHIRPIGTNRWQTPDGLVFYDNATTYPDPPSSRIIEVKLSTCGDF